MLKQARIIAIDYHLPDRVVTNEELAAVFPDWPANKILQKTGILERRVVADQETASDLAVMAARKLFSRGVVSPNDIDFLLFCTQSPDYVLPSSACVIQRRLGLRTDIGALDVNLGCSGYVYGLSLAKALIETGIANNILLLTGDTYSKFLKADDKTVRTLFGDGASATLVAATECDLQLIGPFVFGTDGAGADYLMYRGGGCRNLGLPAANVGEHQGDGDRSLYMNGPAILTFTMRVVPESMQRLFQKAGVSSCDIDYFVFHQANKYVLDVLRDCCDIPSEKLPIRMKYTGNTVSSTIPIAIRQMSEDGVLAKPTRTMLVGYGVGLSWGACLATLPANP